MNNGTVTARSYTDPQATVHVLSGSAGPPEWDVFLPVPHNKSWSREPRIRANGYGRVTVYNSSTLSFEQVGNDNGAVLDKFTIVQRKRPPRLKTDEDHDEPPPPLGDAPEPYKPLHGGGFTGPAAALSPDPLVQYQYSDPSINYTALQIFTVRPVAVTVLAGGHNCAGCARLASAAPAATVTGPCILRFDFGAELPAWFELDAPAYNASTHAPLTMGIGEYHGGCARCYCCCCCCYSCPGRCSALH